MRRSLLLAAAGTALVLASALAFRYSASEPAGPMTAGELASPASVPGAEVPPPAMPSLPAKATAARPHAGPLPVATAVVQPGAYRVSAADSGAGAVAPAPTHFTGPDGELLLVTEAGPDAAIATDEVLRAAVLEEIKDDPESFAAAMRLEAGEVRAVASGERELPVEWILAAR